MQKFRGPLRPYSCRFGLTVMMCDATPFPAYVGRPMHIPQSGHRTQHLLRSAVVVEGLDRHSDRSKGCVEEAEVARGRMMAFHVRPPPPPTPRGIRDRHCMESLIGVCGMRNHECLDVPVATFVQFPSTLASSAVDSDNLRPPISPIDLRRSGPPDDSCCFGYAELFLTSRFSTGSWRSATEESTVAYQIGRA